MPPSNKDKDEHDKESLESEVDGVLDEDGAPVDRDSTSELERSSLLTRHAN